MLICGSILTILAGCMSGITSSEWARIGLPLGMALMTVFFAMIFVPAWMGCDDTFVALP
ncbi:DUF1646 family protein [Methanoregula sp.]|uniref:DUF1646 family protein n=1 Tax=Methanoregula sp. TaxID=2052170 RepID=UPI0025E053D4|nr:DUF1646 family protein [Methanoregula sp.]